MTSAHNLLGLVSQLQTMENTFTSILMETALKLSSLTDAKVFVLVESSDARRFAGAPHLCQSYASSGLFPIGNDIEVSLDQSLPSLKERRLHPPSTTSPFHSFPLSHTDTAFHNHVSQSSRPSGLLAGRKRSAYLEKDSISPSKQLRTEEVKVEGDVKPVTGSAISEDGVLCCGPGGKFTEAGYDSDDADSDVILEDESFSIQTYSPPVNDCPQFNHFENEQIGNTSTNWIREEFLQNNPKAALVKNISDASIVDKNSINFKVFNSFMYDFGKEVAIKCPPHIPGFWKNFFAISFRECWSLFPNLQLLDNSGLSCMRGTKEKLSLKAFARVASQVACRWKIKKSLNITCI